MNINNLLRSLSRDIGQSSYTRFKRHALQERIYNDRTSKEMFLFAANRVGKTTLGVELIKGMCNGTYAPLNNYKDNYTVCVHSQDMSLNLTIIIPKIIDMVPRSWLEDSLVNAKSKTPAFSTIKGPKATVTVVFKSGDQATEKLAGAEYDLVWIDEYVEEDHYSELKARTVSVNGIMLTTYTMVNGICWLYDVAKHNTMYTASMLDNPHLDQKVVREYAEGLSEEERKIRVEGEILDLSGLRYLSGDPMQYLQELCRKPVEIKRVVREGRSLTFEEDPAGDLFFFFDDFDEFDIFSIGADVASGEGIDYSTIDVNRLTANGFEQFCLYRSKTTDIPVFSKILYTLAKHFNMAVVNVDVTGMGISVISELLLLKYPNIASRENPDAISTTDSLGFRFTSTSRSVLLSEYRKALQKKQLKIYHAQTIGEIGLYQFINGRFDHISSTTNIFAHDDCLIASAIAWYSIRFATHLFAAQMERRLLEQNKNKPMTWNDLEKFEKSQLEPDDDFDDRSDVYDDE